MQFKKRIGSRNLILQHAKENKWNRNSLKNQIITAFVPHFTFVIILMMNEWLIMNDLVPLINISGLFFIFRSSFDKYFLKAKLMTISNWNQYDVEECILKFQKQKFPPRSTVANKTEVPKGMSGGGTVFAMILVWIPNLSLQSNTLSKYIQSQQQKRKNLVKDLFAKIFNGFLPLTAFTKILS